MSTSGNSSAITATDADRELLAALEVQLKKLRPIFQEEGGDVQISSIESGIARLAFISNACAGCGGGLGVFEGGLRLMLLERVPGLKDVVFET